MHSAPDGSSLRAGGGHNCRQVGSGMVALGLSFSHGAVLVSTGWGLRERTSGGCMSEIGWRSTCFWVSTQVPACSPLPLTCSLSSGRRGLWSHPPLTRALIPSWGCHPHDLI